mmetsp:Transcript_37147/g.73950  ORF Transcript_37147/g.73950 Transcript_37147/m.73950 type:complete len:253 (-) Transcript_37147:417-1175(-)
MARLRRSALWRRNPSKAERRSLPAPPQNHRSFCWSDRSECTSEGRSLATGSCELLLGDMLRDDHCVQRRPAQELVPGDEELQAVVAVDQALAHAANLDIRLPRRVQGHGVEEVRWVVHDLDADGLAQHLEGLLRVDLLLRLDDDGLGMGAEGGHAHGGARNLDIGEVEDLLDLPVHLHLLLGVAVGLEGIDLGDHVEGQLVLEDLGRWHLPGRGVRLEARLQLRHALGAGAAGGLVGRHQHGLELVLLVQGP